MGMSRWMSGAVVRRMIVAIVTNRAVRRCESAGPRSEIMATGAVAAVPNPMGTDGFEFVEYTAPDANLLRTLFERLGFPVVARHRAKNVTLHKQGDINFIINAEPDSFGQAFTQAHGPSVCAMGFRVQDAAAAFERAIQLGAEPHRGSVGPMELNIPAIVGIGG